MKKLSISILCLLLLGNFSIFSQPAKDGPPFGQRGNRIKMALKLTPEQEKKFDDLKYQQQQSVVDIRAKIQKNRLELKKMISDGNFNEKNILQLVDDNSKLQGDIKHSATKHLLDVYKILNDEQKAIFTKFISRIGENRGAMGRMKAGANQWMGRRGPGMMNRQGKQLPPKNEEK
jgi:Spy/CpxP family protein refolding chaperone